MPEFNELVGAPLSPEQKLSPEEQLLEEEREAMSMKEQVEESAKDAGVVIISLDPYIQHVKRDKTMAHWHRNRDYYHLPDDGKLGRRAAKETNFVELLETSNQVAFQVTKPIDFVHSDNSFVKSYLRVGAKALGLPEMAKKLAVMENHNGYSIEHAVTTFIRLETERLKKKAEKDAKKAAEESDENWLGPVQFFVPEIGTNIKLTEDWTFELYGEYRNDGLLDLIGVPQQGRWAPEGGYKHAPVTIVADATLTVDRIYVRKGVQEYSSLTFWLGKHAQVDYHGGSFITQKRIRFWAKLSDVNQINGLVSMVTVPGML